MERGMISCYSTTTMPRLWKVNPTVTGDIGPVGMDTQKISYAVLSAAVTMLPRLDDTVHRRSDNLRHSLLQTIDVSAFQLLVSRVERHSPSDLGGPV
jgi:hypothetical protein